MLFKNFTRLRILNKETSYFYFSYLLLTLIPCVAAIAIGVPWEIVSKSVKGNLILSTIILPVHVLLNLRMGYLALLIISSVLGFLSIIDLIHLSIFQTFPTKSVFFTIFESHSLEAGEFLSTYFGIKEAILILAYIGSCFVWYQLRTHFQSKFNKSLNLIINLATILFLVFLLGFDSDKTQAKLQKHSSLRLFFAIHDYKREMDVLNSQMNLVPPSNFIKSNKSTEKDIIVIVIGESTSRNHMGLYGYKRQTNPLLMNQDLIAFSNAISPHSHTLQSLGKILTFDSHDIKAQIDSPDIVTLANLAGYKTYWISNQASLGAWETKTTAIAGKANYKKFCESF